MIDKAEERRLKAGEAQRLLDEPLLNEVLGRLHQSALDDLLAAQPGADREEVYLVMSERMRAVRWIRDELTAIVRTHENEQKRQLFTAV